MKGTKAKCKIWEKKHKDLTKPRSINLYFFSYKLNSLQKIFSDEYYPLRFFLRWALWADSVSLPINTIVSHDQFKMQIVYIQTIMITTMITRRKAWGASKQQRIQQNNRVSRFYPHNTCTCKFNWHLKQLTVAYPYKPF